MRAGAIKQYLANNYGGTRAYGHHLWHGLLGSISMYRELKREDLATANRLVFLCKGNICRSPYAEVKARQLGLHAVSAGLDTSPGKAANSVAQVAAKARGVDLSEHQTQQLSALNIQSNDLVFVMEPAQIPLAKAQLGADAEIILLGLYARPRRAYLQDPYLRAAPYFDVCYNVIDDALTRLSVDLSGCKI